jgi:type IV pilus assembly protein PilX
MKSLPLSLYRSPAQARGAALIISLVILVVITLLGVASLRNVVLEEKMVTNYYDRSLAFQAAEAGLRAGEALALSQAQAIPPHAQGQAQTVPTAASQCSSSCNGGICSPPGEFCPARWNMDTFSGWVNVTGLSLTSQAGNAPQYFIEYLGNTFPCDPATPTSNLSCARYRVTARSNAGDGRAVVMLQSIYATQ